MTISEARQVQERMPIQITKAGLLDFSKNDVKKVIILKTLWYPEIMNALEASAREYLASWGIPADRVETLQVPGSFELPLAATLAIERRKPSFVIALGCIVKGDTPHFDFVSQASLSGLMEVQLRTKIPVGMGILTVDQIAQAEVRKDKGNEAAQAAHLMAASFRHLF